MARQFSFEEAERHEATIDALKQEVEELRRTNSAKDAELEQVKTELRKAKRTIMKLVR